MTIIRFIIDDISSYYQKGSYTNSSTIKELHKMHKAL